MLRPMRWLGRRVLRAGTSGTGRCSCSPAPRLAALARGGVAVALASLVPAWLTTAGSRSRCGTRRCTSAALGSRSPRGWPGRRWPSASASCCRRASPRRPPLAGRRARPRAPPQLRAREQIQRSATRAAAAAARRRRRPRPRVRRRLPGRRARGARSPACVYGDRALAARPSCCSATRTRCSFPALERIAKRRHWRLVKLTKGGCPPLRVRVLLADDAAQNPSCATWREHTLRRIERRAPGAGRRRLVGELHGPRRRAQARPRREHARARAGYAPTLARLRAAAGRVAVLTDAPRPPQNIPSCVSGAMRRLRRCAFARGPAVARAVRDPRCRRAACAGVATIDATSQFCLAGPVPGGDRRRARLPQQRPYHGELHGDDARRGSSGTCRRHGAQEPAHDDRDARLYDTASTGGRRFARPGRAPGSAPRRRRACAPIRTGGARC